MGEINNNKSVVIEHETIICGWSARQFVIFYPAKFNIYLRNVGDARQLRLIGQIKKFGPLIT